MASLGCEQPLLQAGPGSLLEPLSFFDRHQNRGLHSAPRNHLWTLLDGCIQELAEARLRVLYLPRSQDAPSCFIFIVLTSQMTSQLIRSGNHPSYEPAP